MKNMPRKKAEAVKSADSKAGIEENFAELEKIIGKLEAGDNTLEESFADYAAGMKLVKTLSIQIDKVEKQIQILSEGDDNE